MHSFSLRHQGDVLTDQVDGVAAGGVGVVTEEVEAESGVSSRGGAGVERQSVAGEAATGSLASASASAPAFTHPPAAAPVHAAATAALPPAAGADAVDTNPKEMPEYSCVLGDDLTNPASGLAALGNGAFTWAACAWPFKTVFVAWVSVLKCGSGCVVMCSCVPSSHRAQNRPLY